MKTIQMVLVLFSLCLGVFASDKVKFSVKPTVKKVGNKTVIDFTVSKSTDVEVAIIDSENKVIRHLAAGVLEGKNPPPPPLMPGLAQTLEWDGNDDFGKPASSGSFKFQVRLGTSVEFGKMIGTSPYTGSVSGDSLAVDKDGSLYIKMASLINGLHAGYPWQLRKFDKDNKYVKTLLPHPASTDSDKTMGMKLIDTGNKDLTPAHNSPLDAVLFKLGNNIYNKVVDGQIIFIDNDGAKLNMFKLDGSNAVKTVAMRTAPEKLKWAGYLAPQLAFSPDGKYAYYSNVAMTPYDAKKPADIDPNFPQGRVYRQDLSLPNSNPEKFYDLVLPDFEKTPYWMPSAWDKKSAAAGISVDNKGNLFVCDLVNQEVVEVSTDGQKVSSAKMPWPDKVEVSSKTGTLYVISRAVSRGWPAVATLLKVTGRGTEVKIVAKLLLNKGLGNTMALDESKDVPVIILGGGEEVIRIEDRGTEFVIVGPSLLNPSKDDISFFCYGAVDPEAELVYVTTGMGPVWQYNGETGAGGLMPIKACDVAIGPNGIIFGWGETGSHTGVIARYSRDGKPAPLESTKKNVFGFVNGRFGRGNSAPGMAVNWLGQVFVTSGFNDCHVRGYDTDGKLIEFERKAVFGKNGKKPGDEPSLISYVYDIGGSIKFDPAGNIYVLANGLPKDFVPQKGYEKDAAYNKASGVVYKFTSKGGEFKRTPEGWHAEGSVGRYMVACGPLSGDWNSTMSACHCMRPRFDVDSYGRLYIPNGITYKVSMRDNADNEIITFGAYGNYDSQGPKSSEAKPEIPLGWPIFAGASNKYIYVGDGLNHRVVRVDKKFAATETCDIK